jgi:hypothetical protein
MATKTKEVASIKAPNLKTAVFDIKGTSPLVIHRFSQKIKNEMRDKMEMGKSASSKKAREAKDLNETYLAAKYNSREGWEGFNATAIRRAMISACRLVSFKMTLAKLSVFVIPDGWDEREPQIPLIRIYGESVQQEDMVRVANGMPTVAIRAAYHNWSSKVKIRWDADQFNQNDIYNLLYRVGTQVGICEGRNDGKTSSGMGWGAFTVENGEIYAEKGSEG